MNRRFVPFGLRLALALCAALVPCCAGLPSHPDVTYRDGLRIPSGGAGDEHPAVLAANVFIPAAPPDSGRFPVVVFPNSWGFAQHEYRYQALRFARFGYIAFSYSARGWGESTGEVDVGGPDDMADLHALLDWIVKHTPADPERIGLAGISYGAGLSLLAAAHDDRVKAVASMSGWSTLLGSFYENGTPSVLWTRVLKLTADYRFARLGDTLNRDLEGLIHYRVRPDEEAWARKRSPMEYLDRYNRRGVPIYLSSNLEDDLFLPNDTLLFYERLETPKRIDFNQGMHGTAEWGGVKGHKNLVWDHVLDWFDRHLKGKRVYDVPGCSPEENRVVHVQPVGWEEHQRVVLAPPFVREETLFLSFPRKGQGALLREPPELPGPGRVLRRGNCGLSSGASHFALFELLRLRTNVVEPVYADLSAVDERHGCALVSALPLSPSCQALRGVPEADFWVRPLPGGDPQGPVAGQLVVYLYDVDATGRGRLITFGPATFYGPADRREPIGVSVRLRLAAYDIPIGHRLGLGIGTQDPLYLSENDRWKSRAVEVICSPEKGVHASLKVPFETAGAGGP